MFNEKILKKIKIENINELKDFVKSIQSYLQKKTILLLDGPVGVGKTETVKAINQLLGAQEVASPSFAIHHSYISQSGLILDHLDLYRLENEDDLESTGFWDLFNQDNNLIIIEWADRLNLELLPYDWKKIKIHFELKNNLRTIQFSEIIIKQP